MRIRVFPVLLLLLLAGLFALLNWPAFAATTTLSLGFTTVQASPALVMLVLVALLGMAYVASVVYLQGAALLESRRLGKELQAQRELADKAEASRFTELRQHLDAQLRELRQRDAIAATEFEKAMVGSQRELRTQLDQVSRVLDTRLAELETRLDARFERLGGRPVAPAEPLRDARLHGERVEVPTTRHPL